MQAQSADVAPATRWKFGVQAGTVQGHHDTEPVAQISFGYDIDAVWSVEALANVSLLFERDGGLAAGHAEFDDAYGARVLASLPLSDRWKLVGGLGIVRARYDEAATFDDGGFSFPSRRTVEETGPMVSLAAMYRANRHWSLGAEVSSFTQQHTLNLGLRGELHF